MRPKPVPFPVYQKIAADIVDKVGGPGALACDRCHLYAVNPLTIKLIAGYLATGWPVHCGQQMRWVTGRELAEEAARV